MSRRAGGYIAHEIEDQLLILADPKTQWVQEFPREHRQACAAVSNWHGTINEMAYDAQEFLNEYLTDVWLADDRFAPGDVNFGLRMITAWNDGDATNCQQVIDMLLDAFYAAVDAGL